MKTEHNEVDWQLSHAANYEALANWPDTPPAEREHYRKAAKRCFERAMELEAS